MNTLEQKIAGLDPSRLPVHVAIIMDGNGRWAKLQGKERYVGHYAGVDAVREAVRAASDLGIRYLTLYAFSTENWHRPSEEVEILMHLIGCAIENERPELMANNVRLCLLGDIDRIPEDSRRRLLTTRDALEGNTGLTLTLALSYSSRWEITEAARKIAEDAAQGNLSPDDISEERFAQTLPSAPTPDPDLLIRTGGDSRISNFLLWQIAYAELYFTPILWPDFRRESFVDALLSFQSRERRYGMTSAQVASKFYDYKDETAKY